MGVMVPMSTTLGTSGVDDTDFDGPVVLFSVRQIQI